MQNDKVFVVVNNSPFAFLGYRYLLENGVPMVGGGFDGNEYGQPGNEKLISILGNIAPGVRRAVHGRASCTLMKKAGAKKVGVVSYGVVGVVDGIREEPAEVRGAGAGLDRCLHEHDGRVRHDRRRSARARA